MWSGEFGGGFGGSQRVDSYELLKQRIEEYHLLTPISGSFFSSLSHQS